MISNSEENSQQNLNDEVADVSGDVVAKFVASSPIDPKLSGGFDLSEDDLAEYAAGIGTPHEAKETALPEDRRKMLDAALADLDLDDLPVEPSRNKVLSKLYQDSRNQADIERNQRNGHIAQVMNEIDDYRKTPAGRADYNANRREKRRKDAVAEGRTIKPRKHYDTQDESTKAHADAKQAYKDRKKDEFALMSPDKQQALRDEQAKKKREQRQRRKAEAAKALADKAIF